MEVTLTLPDELLIRARAIAQRSGRRLEEVLSETIASSLAGGGESIESIPWADRSDDEVIGDCNRELDPGEDEELSNLLKIQREGQLEKSDRGRLTALMRRYEDFLLIKAEATREAVKRGLIPPLDT